MKSAPVCVDTNICIWGIKQQERPGHDGESERIIRARKLFSDLSVAETPVWLPAIVLAELLIREVGTPQLDAFHSDICTRFHILVFNAMCAKRHAEMMATLDKKEIERLKKMDANLTAARLKADFQIISTMLGHSVKELYTTDPSLTIFAKNAGLTVHALPPFQATIFDPPTGGGSK